jgi:hypothetical protein
MAGCATVCAAHHQGVLSALASAGFILPTAMPGDFCRAVQATPPLWAVTNGVLFFGDFPDSTHGWAPPS